MPKYIIQWNTGYGDSHEIIESSNMECAEHEAYEFWKEEAENNAVYGAEEYTKEKAIELCLEDDPEDE